MAFQVDLRERTFGHDPQVVFPRVVEHVPRQHRGDALSFEDAGNPCAGDDHAVFRRNVFDERRIVASAVQLEAMGVYVVCNHTFFS